MISSILVITLAFTITTGETIIAQHQTAVIRSKRETCSSNINGRIKELGRSRANFATKPSNSSADLSITTN